MNVIALARFLAVLLFVGTSLAQSITSFDVPASTGTIPRAINSVGEIVGDYYDLNGRSRGFLQRRNGKFITLNLYPVGSDPTHWQTHGVSINATGTMIGYFSIGGGGDFAFLRRPNGTVIQFTNTGDLTSSSALAELAEPSPVADCLDGTEPRAINDVGQITGSVHCIEGLLRERNGSVTQFRVNLPTDLAWTLPQAINAKGQIAGYYIDRSSSWTRRGFLRKSDGSFIQFDVPDSAATLPKTLNDSGQISGSYIDSTTTHGFLRRRNGGLTTFDPPGSIGTEVTAMNNEGDITGFYATADGIYHGFVRNEDGDFESFDAPGLATGGIFPQGINDAGEIVGYYQDANFVLHGFLRRTCNTR